MRPLLYLRGLSSGDFVPACRRSSARRRPLRLDREPPHRGMAGGVGALAAAEPRRHRLCLALGRRRALRRAPRGGPVVLPGAGRRAARRPQVLVAVQDGYREDTQSWLDLLRDLRERGSGVPAEVDQSSWRSAILWSIDLGDSPALQRRRCPGTGRQCAGTVRASIDACTAEDGRAKGGEIQWETPQPTVTSTTSIWSRSRAESPAR